MEKRGCLTGYERYQRKQLSELFRAYRNICSKLSEHVDFVAVGTSFKLHEEGIVLGEFHAFEIYVKDNQAGEWIRENLRNVTDEESALSHMLYKTVQKDGLFITANKCLENRAHLTLRVYVEDFEHLNLRQYEALGCRDIYPAFVKAMTGEVCALRYSKGALFTWFDYKLSGELNLSATKADYWNYLQERQYAVRSDVEYYVLYSLMKIYEPVVGFDKKTESITA